MPEGRAERAVEAPAQSIDGAEHGAMLKGVMATAQFQGRTDRTSAPRLASEPGPDRGQIQCHDGGLITMQIAVTRAAMSAHDLVATRTNSDTQAAV